MSGPAWDDMHALAVILEESGIVRGMYAVARRTLASDWLAQRDARIRAEALREAAGRIEDLAETGWGGSASWVTTGSHVGYLAATALRSWAAAAPTERTS